MNRAQTGICISAAVTLSLNWAFFFFLLLRFISRPVMAGLRVWMPPSVLLFVAIAMIALTAANAFFIKRKLPDRVAGVFILLLGFSFLLPLLVCSANWLSQSMSPSI